MLGCVDGMDEDKGVYEEVSGGNRCIMRRRGEDISE